MKSSSDDFEIPQDLYVGISQIRGGHTLQHIGLKGLTENALVPDTTRHPQTVVLCPCFRWVRLVPVRLMEAQQDWDLGKLEAIWTP